MIISSDKIENTRMSCYECGKRGHKKSHCPNKVIKCYGCGVVGHYKDKCPILLDQQQKINDSIWFEQYMPDAPLQFQYPISNLQDIKDLLAKHTNYCCCVKIAGFSAYTIDSSMIIKTGKSDALSREVDGMNIDNFALFLSRKQISAQVRCTKYGNTLDYMLRELSTTRILTAVRGNRNKYSYKYYIGDVHVGSIWDERGMESHVPDNARDLIINAYKQYKGNNYDVIDDMRTYTHAMDFKI
jgi:hypothetical protein